MAKYYLHTIGGRPAYFDGNQIVFSLHYSRDPKNVLATSLRQIRDEQRKTKKWRAKKGYDDYDIGNYGYVRVYTPND